MIYLNIDEWNYDSFGTGRALVLKEASHFSDHTRIKSGKDGEIHGLSSFMPILRCETVSISQMKASKDLVPQTVWPH